MILVVLLSIAYIVGGFLSFWMMRVEHESEGELYTKGDQVRAIAWSLLSWITVIIVLIGSWFEKIEKTGYWKEPAKPVKPEIILQQKETK